MLFASGLRSASPIHPSIVTIALTCPPTQRQVIACAASVLAICLVCFVLATPLQRIMGANVPTLFCFGFSGCKVVLIIADDTLGGHAALRRPGEAGVKVLTALMGCILASLAVQFVLSGVAQFMAEAAVAANNGTSATSTHR